MQVTLFAPLERNYSIDRYVEELASGFPADVETRVVRPPRRPGLAGSVVDRYLKYFADAKRHEGEVNIIVSVMYAFLLGRLDRRRTAVVCHDIVPLEERVPFSYDVRYKANLRIASHARALVTVSQYMRGKLLARYQGFDMDQVVAVHNGLSAVWRPLGAETRESLRAEFGFGHSKVVLHVGNDVWHKNLAAIVHACAELSRERGDILLVKAGDLSETSRTLVAEAGLSGRFRHLGPLDSQALVRLYNAADVLVVASLIEGFGWPPLEAMACGLPAVVSNRGSLPEVCGHAAEYVDPRSPASIAAAVRRLLDDGARREELRARGLRRAQDFTWERTAARMLELFRV